MTNEFELSGINADAVAQLVQYIVQAEESAGLAADANKILIVVVVSTAMKYGAPGQSMGQIEALRMAFGTGGRLPDGTVVQGNGFLNQRNVFAERFVVGVQWFQYGDEIAKFTQNVLDKYKNSVPILLTEHGFDSVQAAAKGHGGNGQSHDDANQARIVAKQIDNINQFCKKHETMRGMCVFQWLNTSYKCGREGADRKPIYSNACTESNFGKVQ